MKYLCIYLAIMNAIGLLFMLIDKQKARKKRWRIPERTLMSIAVGGGSVGVLLGMFLVRHKTKHLKFIIGVPVILAVQIVAAVIIMSS